MLTKACTWSNAAGMPRIRGGYINSCSMDSVMAALYHLTKHPVTECGPVLPPAGAGAADAPGDCAGRWARVVAATRPCLTTCAWYGWAWIMRQLAVKEGQGRSALSESAAKMRPHVRRMADHLALIRQRIQGSGQAGRGQGCELKQAVGCGRIAGDMDCGQWAVGGCGGVPCPEDVCAALVAGAWVLAAGYPVNRDHQQAAPGNSSSAVVLISELLQLYCCARDALFSGKGPRRVCKAWQDAMVRYNVAKEMLQVGSEQERYPDVYGLAMACVHNTNTWVFGVQQHACTRANMQTCKQAHADLNL